MSRYTVPRHGRWLRAAAAPNAEEHVRGAKRRRRVGGSAARSIGRLVRVRAGEGECGGVAAQQGSGRRGVVWRPEELCPQTEPPRIQRPASPQSLFHVVKRGEVPRVS